MVAAGPVVVIEALWNRLGIGEILREKLRQKKRALEYERALLAMTANRLCEPESKLGVWDRWLSKVYLPSCEGLLLRQMYEAMDFLYAEARAVEEAVFFHTADVTNAAQLRAAVDAAVGVGNPPRLTAAIRYAMFPPGARLRPRLCLGIAGACGEDQDADAMSLMRWNGVIEEQPQDPQPLRAAALELLAEAAADLRASREREGTQMDAVIRDRLDSITTQVEQVRAWLPEIREGLRQKLLTRIGELKQPLEPGRLEQEVAFLAQKIDVDEELDRLDAHVTEARAILERDEPVGRRLDFLMQEFNREANTLASKSADSETTAAAVELKVLIEQMREQVQNVE